MSLRRATSNVERSEEYTPLDYTTNLLYDFVFNQNFVADTNGTDYDSVTDLVSGLPLSPTLTTEDLAVDGVLQLTIGGQGFTINNNNPGLAATNVTFVFCLAADAPHAESDGIILFDNLTPAPRVILQLETSDVDTNSRVQWNGVEKPFGASFTFDGTFRALAYRFEGTAGQMYVSGTQVGSVSSLTGGQFAMDTVASTRRFLRGASTITRTYKKQIKRIRVYGEAVSPENIALISDIRSTFMNPYPVRPVIIVRWKGQSLAEGGPDSWNVGTMPAELTGNIPRCYKWDNNARVLDPLNATDDTLLSPRMSFSYALSQEYPDHDIINIVGAVGGTNMDSWTPPAGARYTNAKTWDTNLLTHLTVQGRQIDFEILWWNQGQSDSQNSTLSQTAVYGPKELSFFNQELIDNNPDLILTSRMRTDLPPPTTVENVNNINAAKNANAAQFSKCIIYDDAEEISGDDTHHTQTGNINLGYATATLAINYINSLAI